MQELIDETVQQLRSTHQIEDAADTVLEATKEQETLNNDVELGVYLGIKGMMIRLGLEDTEDVIVDGQRTP